MDEFLSIGHPNIPTPIDESVDVFKYLAMIGLGVAIGIVFYSTLKKQNEGQY